MGINETIWPGVFAALIGFGAIYFLAAHIARRGAAWPRFVRIGYVSAVVLLAVGWSVGVHAWLIEPRTLVVRHVEVVSENWSGSPVTIGAIADTHVPGPHSDPARVRRVVAEMNRLNPDVVVLLGDYVGEGEQRIDRSENVYAATRQGIAAFAGLRAPYGVFAVLGNRDRRFDRDLIAQSLDLAHVVLLSGRSVRVTRPDGDFEIVGLTNEEDAAADVDTALAAAPSGDRIVISHSPEPFEALPSDVALMLAGHTHCGQVSVPFLGRPITHLGENSAYACHRVDERGHTLYTTAGIGTSGLPVRFLNPPEIVLITLRSVN